jgi:hypothetical protein
MKVAALLLLFLASFGLAEQAKGQDEKNYKGWKKGDWVFVILGERNWYRGGDPKLDSPVDICWGKIEEIAPGTLIVKKYYSAEFRNHYEMDSLSKDEIVARVKKTDPRKENLKTAKIYEIQEWLKDDYPAKPSFLDMFK